MGGSGGRGLSSEFLLYRGKWPGGAVEGTPGFNQHTIICIDWCVCIYIQSEFCGFGFLCKILILDLIVVLSVGFLSIKFRPKKAAVRKALCDIRVCEVNERCRLQIS